MPSNSLQQWNHPLDKNMKIEMVKLTCFDSYTIRLLEIEGRIRDFKLYLYFEVTNICTNCGKELFFPLDAYQKRTLLQCGKTMIETVLEIPQAPLHKPRV